MATTRIDSTQSTVLVEPTRPRQTERPATPFRNVLAGGVNVLMAGAEAATSLVAGPVLAAAVHEARTDVVGGIQGRAGDSVTPALGLGAAHSGGTPDTDMATAQSLQRESQAFNLQLIALQEEMQQENRRFSTLSNVLRARHDTAKAAISNIRG